MVGRQIIKGGGRGEGKPGAPGHCAMFLSRLFG